MADPKILKKKIFISFGIIIVLIIFSGIFGWVLTKQIEKSDKKIEVVHQLKESELQLRREEKNLLIRGYSQERYLRWQKAKENFHQNFGELIGLKALTDAEAEAIKSDYSEMSGIYKKFFDEILTRKLSPVEIAEYDSRFKNIGRKTLDLINNILIREQSLSSSNNSQTDILIGIFLVIFVATAGFLIVNVLKHL